MRPLLLPRTALARVSVNARRFTSGTYRVPKSYNEPNLHFAPGSPERDALATALAELRAQLPLHVPAVGSSTPTPTTPTNSTTETTTHVLPSSHATPFSHTTPATPAETRAAISRALAARHTWSRTPFHDRASIFLRAAELVSGPYRLPLLATTMLGQGKNAWQAEIDAAAELADFFRYNVAHAQAIYDAQPEVNSPGHHGRTDHRPLEGFVYAVSPFNFTAIGGNLVSAPAIMGNVVLWKPSPAAAAASALVHRILREAGLPEGVVELVNGDAGSVTDEVFAHREFAALAFIGSSDVFRGLWARAARGVGEGRYRDFPRLVGETSGKNFHLLHGSADVPNAARHTVRAAFEYAGQKCSACSRVYVPASRADEFFDTMRAEMRRLKVGPPEEMGAFTGPVIDRRAFERITGAIDAAKSDEQVEVVAGGTYDGSVGWFVDPTLLRVAVPDHELLNRELFGPVLAAYVYPDAEFDGVLESIDGNGGGFALTGNIFASDQAAIRKAEDRLRYAAGNFYVNCKITAAVIGQQTFGGSRSSGTCDKAGSAGLLTRFTAPRTLKEEYNKLDEVLYPSNL